MVVTEILPEADVRAITFNLQTNRIYVSDWPKKIFVIDSITFQEIGEISHYAYTSDNIAVNPVTNLIYIEDPSAVVGEYDCLAVYDGETNTLLTEVNMPGSNTHKYFEDIRVAVNPETNRIYATWSGDNSLHVIDGDTNSIIKTISPSSFPWRYDMFFRVNPCTNYVYVGSVVLDGESLEEVFSNYEGDIKAVDPINNLVYTMGQYYNLTSHSFEYNLWVLNGTTHDVLTIFELDSWELDHFYDEGLAVNCNNNKIYIINSSETYIPVLIPELSSLMLLSTLIAATVAILVQTKKKN